jgi:hypothetical protein
MSNDDANSMIAIGFLFASFVFLGYAFRPEGKTFEDQPKQLQQIMEAWGIRDLETWHRFGLFFGLGIGVLIALVGLAFKFAGPKP